MWVANNGSNNITQIRASDAKVIGHTEVGKGPWGIVFDGASLWVANNDDGSVSNLRLRIKQGILGTQASIDKSQSDERETGESPSSVVFDGTFIYVTNFGDGTITRH